MAKPLHERLRSLLPDKVREKIPEKWQPPAWRSPTYEPSPWAGEDLEWNPGDPAEVPTGAYALGDSKGRKTNKYIEPGTKGKVVAVAEGFVVFWDGEAGYQLLKSDVRSLVPQKERRWAQMLRYVLDEAAAERLLELWGGPAQREFAQSHGAEVGAELEWLSVADLRVRPFDEKRFAPIDKALREGTPLPPIEVFRDDQGRLEVTDGQHRVEMARRLGIDKVPAVVRWETPTRTATSEFKVKRLSDAALTALQIYIFDPVHADFGDEFPGRVEGRTLYVTDPERAWELLSHASNSADDDKDAASRNALFTLAGKVLRGKKADLIPGGKGDDMPDEAFDEVELELGIEDELEHTTDPAVAKEIAKDHLVGDPAYYSKMGQYEVVYHGSREPDIKALEGSMPPYAGGIGAGVYVAFDPEVAAFYGPYVYELRLHVPASEILWLTPDTIDYSLGELLPNSILVGEQVMPFSFYIGDQKYSVVADEREALEAIAAREMRNALPEVGGEWEAFREHFEAASRWLDTDDAYEYLSDGFIEQGFDVETAEAKAHAMAEWYRDLEMQVLANAEQQLGLAIDLSEIGGEAASAGYRAVYLEGVRAGGSVDSELLVFDAGDLEMLGQTREAQKLRLNVWIDPQGQVYESGKSHDSWALAERGKTANDLLDAGWIRVAPPDGVQVRNVQASMSRVMDLVRKLFTAYPDGAGVWIEDDDGNYFVRRTETSRPDFSELQRQSRSAAGVGVEQAIDELARGDVGLRRQLEEAARRLLSVGWEGDEPEFRGALQRERDKAKFVRSMGLDDATKTKPDSWRGVELAGETERYFVLKVLDHEGARAIGTKAWCIVRDEGAWDNYAEEGITFYFYVDKQLGPPAALALAVHPTGNTELYDSQDKLMPCFLSHEETEPVAKTLSGAGAETFRTLQEAQRHIANPQTSTEEVIRALSDFGGAIDPRQILVAAVSRADFEQIWDKLGFVQGAQAKLLPVLKAVRHQFAALQKLIPESFGTVNDVDVDAVELTENLDGGYVNVDVFFTSGVTVGAGAWIKLENGEIRPRAYEPSQWGLIEGLAAPDREDDDWDTFVELVQDASTRPEVEEAVRDALAEQELKNTSMRNSVERKWRVPETDAALVDWIRDYDVTDLREWTAAELLDKFEELGHSAQTPTRGDWLDYTIARGDWSDRYYFGAEDAGAEATDGPFETEDEAMTKANEVLLGIVEALRNDAIELQTSLTDVENWLDEGANSQVAASWQERLEWDETGVLRDFLDGLDALEWQALPLSWQLQFAGKTADDVVADLQRRIEDLAERRRRGVIEVTAAGLPAVGMAAKKFAAMVKAVIDKARGPGFQPGQPNMFRDVEGAQEMIDRTENMLSVTVPLTEYLDPELIKTKAAQARLHYVNVYVTVDSSSKYKGYFSPHEHVIVINVTANELLYDDSYRILMRVQQTMEHEVRHAIDWAYNPNAFVQRNPGESVVNSVARTRRWWGRYLNQPTELMAWAGNIAHGLPIRPSSWERLKFGLDDYKVWVEDEGSVPVLELIEEENRPRLLQMILKAYDQANPPGKKGPNKWQVMKSDLLAKRKIPESFVASLLPFVYGVQKREGLADEPTWQEWVKHRSTDQIVMEAENQYAVYKVLKELPKNALGEYPPLASMIDDWRQKNGLPHTMRPETADAWSSWERAS